MLGSKYLVSADFVQPRLEIGLSTVSQGNVIVPFVERSEVRCPGIGPLPGTSRCDPVLLISDRKLSKYNPISAPICVSSEAVGWVGMKPTAFAKA